MIESLKIIFLSVVYGFTALLPTSSLGHFSLLKEVLGYTDENFNASFYYALFSIAAGVAMYIYYFSVHSKILKNVFRKKASLESDADIAFNKAGRNIILSLLPILVLFIPVGKTSFIGSLGAYFLSDDSLIFVGLASIFCAVLMFISGWYMKSGYGEKKNLSSSKNAVFFGIYQLPAYIFPGLSHVSVGASRIAVSDIDIKNILKETYLYLAPSLIITGVSRVIFYFNGGEGILIPAALIGFAVSFFMSLGVLWFINKFFSKKTYRAFSVYTLVFGLIVTGTSLYGMLAL